MLQPDRPTIVILPVAHRSRLTHGRLRRPTPLPSMRATTEGLGGYLRRLIWRFVGV